jgi:hypothetical protein
MWVGGIVCGIGGESCMYCCSIYMYDLERDVMSGSGYIVGTVVVNRNANTGHFNVF